jgi:hypothetical protein
MMISIATGKPIVADVINYLSVFNTLDWKWQPSNPLMAHGLIFKVELRGWCIMNTCFGARVVDYPNEQMRFDAMAV